MLLEELDLSKLPRHVAVIMDGNGRWAERQGVSRAEGHEAGARSVRKVIEASRELGIEALTLYAFSTENWRRSRREVDALFRLLSKYVALELENLHKEDIRVNIIGRRKGLPKRVAADLARCEERTRGNTAMTLSVAINYGGRGEIADAAKAIAEEVRDGTLALEDVDEACVAQHLYTVGLPEPDLLVRTSGELRLSNFLLWQLSYAEIIVTETLWPDFGKEEFAAVLAEYQRRERRYGGRKMRAGSKERGK